MCLPLYQKSVKHVLNFGLAFNPKLNSRYTCTCIPKIGSRSRITSQNINKLHGQSLRLNKYKTIPLASTGILSFIITIFVMQVLVQPTSFFIVLYPPQWQWQRGIKQLKLKLLQHDMQKRKQKQLWAKSQFHLHLLPRLSTLFYLVPSIYLSHNIT